MPLPPPLDELGQRASFFCLPWLGEDAHPTWSHEESDDDEGDPGEDSSPKEGHDAATVQRVWRLLEAAEYKRRQAPPGVKITSRLISRERRYPIVNRFRG